MTKSRQNRIDAVLRNGQIVMTMQSTDKSKNLTGRIYRTSESRGYKTGFSLKHFFYIVSFENGCATWIEGITKDSRRKSIFDHMAQHGITHQIVNQEAFDEWVA